MKRVTDYFTVIPSKKSASAKSIPQPIVRSTEKAKTLMTTDTKSSPDDGTQIHKQEIVAKEGTVAEAEPAVKPATVGQQETDAKQETIKKQEPKSSSAWDKKAWIDQSSPENRDLLQLEINTMGDSWLAVLHKELTKPYFISLKKFLKSRRATTQVFPPPEDVYSWSRSTPLHKVEVLVIGQDPYHNVGQAHGLAFSVRPPTRPPPSLINIFKELRNCYPDSFEIPKHGNLEDWARQGVLLLNTCLTVDAHSANSHANKGWEQFTEQVIRAALTANKHVVIMAWGSPAFKRVEKVRCGNQHLVLRSVHPSPLSAARGWFGSAHFTKANDWLTKNGRPKIDWHLK